MVLPVPTGDSIGHAVEMDQRALILHHLTGPTNRAGTDMLNERTVERLYGLSAAHPSVEVHDVGAVANALRDFDPD